MTNRIEEELRLANLKREEFLEKQEEKVKFDESLNNQKTKLVSSISEELEYQIKNFPQLKLQEAQAASLIVHNKMWTMSCEGFASQTIRLTSKSPTEISFIGGNYIKNYFYCIFENDKWQLYQVPAASYKARFEDISIYDISSVDSISEMVTSIIADAVSSIAKQNLAKPIAGIPSVINITAPILNPIKVNWIEPLTTTDRISL